MTKPKVAVNIDSNATFNAWRKEIRSLLFSDFPEYTFNLPVLSEVENKELTRQVKNYTGECGCQTGSFLMSMIFIGSVAWYFISGNKFSEISFRDVLLLGGFTLAGAITGKVAGLISARWKLIKLSNELNEKIRINLTYKLN
jgi:hypothetical protein